MFPAPPEKVDYGIVTAKTLTMEGRQSSSAMAPEAGTVSVGYNSRDPEVPKIVYLQARVEFETRYLE
jgi:hypothetical protein